MFQAIMRHGLDLILLLLLLLAAAGRANTRRVALDAPFSSRLPQLVEERLSGSELHAEAARNVDLAAVTDSFVILSG
jgi:hypothetical protein